MSQLAFDEQTASRLESMYLTRDAIRRRRLVRRALDAAAGERILDLGCGPGFYCAELAEEVGSAGSVVGVDASPHMLALAARRCEELANVELREAHATAVPLEDGSFDAAACVQVLEYVTDVGAALAELHRTLRPGGRAVVWDTDWATVSWHSAQPARMARVLAAWDEHLAHPSLPRVLAAAMRAVGFEQVRMEAHPFATGAFAQDSFAAATVPVIGGFVAGRGGIDEEEARAWAAEQQALAATGEFHFACLQFCFSGRRAGR